MNVYESCPTFITQRFVLRLVKKEDAEGLLRVYSDTLAQPYFNADNCTGDFRMHKMEDMQACVDMWLWSYDRGDFVRWTVLHKDAPVGTVEMFRRNMEDGGTGVLRIDLCHDYEDEDVLDELLEVMLPELFELFGCKKILTKARSFMHRRKASLKRHGFVEQKKPLIGHDGTKYGDYWYCRA